MKAITLWQPWASLWCSPAKIHETRHWKTSHRGPLLVHAAKKTETHSSEEVRQICRRVLGKSWLDLPYGALVGLVIIEDCVLTQSVYPEPAAVAGVAADDFACGNFYPWRYAWRRAPTYIRFEKPIPYKGQQNIFSVPTEVVAAERLAVRLAKLINEREAAP